MTQQTIYRCEGNCNGATFEAGKSCGASDCNLYDVPLKPYKQCKSCSAKSEHDNSAHGCNECTSNSSMPEQDNSAQCCGNCACK